MNFQLQDGLGSHICITAGKRSETCGDEISTISARSGRTGSAALQAVGSVSHYRRQRYACLRLLKLSPHGLNAKTFGCADFDCNNFNSILPFILVLIIILKS